MALVIKSWSVKSHPGAGEPYVKVVARESGFWNFIFSLLGIDATTTFQVTGSRIEFEQGSLSGFIRRLTTFEHICSTFYGRFKPWKTALGIFGFCLFLGSAMQSGWALFAFFVLGAVISGLYYVLNRQLTFGFTDAAGEVAAITFKRSVIEGQEINEEQLHKIIGVIENLIKHRDDHAGEVDIGSGSQGGRMASPAPTSLRQVFNGPDEVTAKPVASAAVQRTAQTGACPKCGNSITPDDVFCGGCGHKLK